MDPLSPSAASALQNLGSPSSFGKEIFFDLDEIGSRLGTFPPPQLTSDIDLKSNDTTSSSAKLSSNFLT